MECTGENAVWSRAFRPSTPRYLITRVLTICHEKHTQSTYCVGAKAFELRSLSPALRNLCLLLVYGASNFATGLDHARLVGCARDEIINSLRSE